MAHAQHELPPHEAWGDSRESVVIVERAAVVPLPPPDHALDEPAAQAHPDQAATWVPGYWHWSADERTYRWVAGIWRRVPPGRRWQAGRWQTNEQRLVYAWLPGRWLRADANDQALPCPPAPREDWPQTAAPSRDHFWVPGTWHFRDDRYQWRAGFWSRKHAPWVWIPDQYLAGLDGCHFVAGYWDFLPGARGESANERRQGGGLEQLPTPSWSVVGSTFPAVGTQSGSWESSHWKIGSRSNGQVELTHPWGQANDLMFWPSGSFAPTYGNQHSREALDREPWSEHRYHGPGRSSWSRPIDIPRNHPGGDRNVGRP